MVPALVYLLPFEHSENNEHQRQSVKLFATLNDDQTMPPPLDCTPFRHTIM